MNRFLQNVLITGVLKSDSTVFRYPNYTSYAYIDFNEYIVLLVTCLVVWYFLA